MSVSNKILLLPKKTIVSPGKSHKINNSCSPDEFLVKLKHHLSHNLLDVPNVCRVSLLAMNKYNLKKIAVLLQYNLLR